MVKRESGMMNSTFTTQSSLFKVGGGNRIRTDDILLAKQALYQLSYTPIWLKCEGGGFLMAGRGED